MLWLTCTERELKWLLLALWFLSVRCALTSVTCVPLAIASWHLVELERLNQRSKVMLGLWREGGASLILSQLTPGGQGGTRYWTHASNRQMSSMLKLTIRGLHSSDDQKCSRCSTSGSWLQSPELRSRIRGHQVNFRFNSSFYEACSLVVVVNHHGNSWPAPGWVGDKRSNSIKAPPTDQSLPLNHDIMFSEDLWSWCGLFESLRRTKVFRDPQDPLSSSDEVLKDLDSPQRMNLCQLLEPNRTSLTRKVLTDWLILMYWEC